MPELTRRVEYIALDAIIPADVNPKRHDLAVLEESVLRWGYVEPVILDERTGKLVAGHGRVSTLMELLRRGLAPPDGIDVADGRWQVPVIRGWSSRDDKEAQAYLLASNRISERGGWNDAQLAEVLAGLEEDLTGIGFDREDVDDLLAKLQESQEIAFDSEHRRQAEARGDSSYKEFKEGYAEKGIRSIVLDYPLEQFERVVELAGVIRRDRGVDSNSDLFVVLLEDAVRAAGPAEGDEVPA